MLWRWPCAVWHRGEENFFKYLLLWASQPTQNWNIPSQEILGWITMYVLYHILVAEDG